MKNYAFLCNALIIDFITTTFLTQMSIEVLKCMVYNYSVIVSNYTLRILKKRCAAGVKYRSEAPGKEDGKDGYRCGNNRGTGG